MKNTITRVLFILIIALLVGGFVAMLNNYEPEKVKLTEEKKKEIHKKGDQFENDLKRKLNLNEKTNDTASYRCSTCKLQ